MKGRHDLVTLLIQKCEELVNVVTYNSETLLHLAVKAKHSEIVELLTARYITKPVLNAKDGNGNTSLHLAVLGRQQKVIKHLLSSDIEVNSINSAGLTPLDLLLVTNNEIGDVYLGEILRAAGGKTANELGDSETIKIHSTSTDGPPTSVRKFSISGKTNEKYDSISNLMVVATLVHGNYHVCSSFNPSWGIYRIAI
ncbi:hypothetical protein LUZ63_013754 [Rhynchospora breviuscula]|uniref:Uncharacterized protein n=1 Tax=Rhynchospora breviuscula TaxID=2022672 RepID=A0A9Q0C9K8_9POAL|nr:hypothetical protein LUZ63_013754 [Rhynchospora breviuscula]